MLAIFLGESKPITIMVSNANRQPVNLFNYDKITAILIVNKQIVATYSIPNEDNSLVIDADNPAQMTFLLSDQITAAQIPDSKAMIQVKCEAENLKLIQITEEILQFKAAYE